MLLLKIHSHLLIQEFKSTVVKDINYIIIKASTDPCEYGSTLSQKLHQYYPVLLSHCFIFSYFKLVLYCAGRIKPSCHWSWQTAFLWCVQARDKNDQAHPSRSFHSSTPTLATNEEYAVEPCSLLRKVIVVCGSHYCSEYQVPAINPAYCTQVCGGFYHRNACPLAAYSRAETFIHPH